MGLLAKNEFHESTKEITQYEINQKKTKKVFFDFKLDSTFKHGDKTTKLIKLRMLDNYDKDKCIAPDTAKYVCFEIPNDMALGELADKKIFDKLDQIGRFEYLMPNLYNNLGLIEKADNSQYQIYNPTSQVLSYTRDILDKEITRNEEMFSQRLKEEFIQRIAVPEIIEPEEQETSKADDVYLEEQFRYKIGNKTYINYKATDVVDGKIININKLSEVDKEDKERLYSAFIQKIDNNKKTEIKTLYDTPYGLPVLFTSQTEIEEMVKKGYKERIYGFVSLVSNLPKTKKTDIRFIGGIDENGNIFKKQENCSNQIKQSIRREKESFKINNEIEEELEIE